MKREDGFTLIEVLVAMTLMLIVVAAVLSTLNDATHATEAVSLMADTQQNLRAGMNYMVRDLMQAGNGIPQNGVTIPNSGGSTPSSSVTRPGPYTAPATSFGTFPTSWTVLPAITPGYQTGPTTSTSGVATDTVTILYADTSLVDSNGNWLNKYPIQGASGTAGCVSTNPNPNPQGTITSAGSGSGATITITFDTSCIVINNGNTGLQAGDLIMLQNNNTTGSVSMTASDASVDNTTAGNVCLMTVSSVNQAANSITFATNDAFKLNFSGQGYGTITNIQSPAGSGIYPVTTATRVWMITYYIDNSNPSRPQLMRQVNLSAPKAVGDEMEHLQVFYDILNAGSSPPTVTTEQENPTLAQLPYIRDAYILLYARSDNKYSLSNNFVRNNLETVVSIRGMDFYNEFNSTLTP
jgi:prepilin-type N-terminal cleavage/methylation domain-containing protein